MSLSRRDLIQRSVLGAGVVAVGNVGALFTGSGPTAGARALAPRRRGGAAGLVPDPNGLLDLPQGFRYKVISQVGDELRNGTLLGDRFDGTGAFGVGRGVVALVRNHEQGAEADYPNLASEEFTYDPGVFGGTSTVVLDRQNTLIDQYVSLAGTSTNCAGGITPWGTWLTCEETEEVAGGTLEQDHGFVFEVDPINWRHNRQPTPLREMGRFAHEATCTDPRTGEVYLTEDAGEPNGLVYRFTPNVPLGGYGSLREGGVLEAMRCRNENGKVVGDLSWVVNPGREFDVEWVRVPDPLAGDVPTRMQFAWDDDPGRRPITRSRKFEGLWWGDDNRAYIVCSFARHDDGSRGEHDGQVWSYDPSAKKLRLEVRFDVNADPEGNGADRPDGPDNITVSPWGGMMLAEDGSGVQHLLLVDSSGVTSLFARNHRDGSEFTGVCFSPNHRTLFANIQAPAVTFAITGPFAELYRTRR